MREILAVRPHAIICIGALATETLLHSKKTILELRGKLHMLYLNEYAFGLAVTFKTEYLFYVERKPIDEIKEDLDLIRIYLQAHIT